MCALWPPEFLGFVQRARDGLGCQVLTLPSDPANIPILRLTEPTHEELGDMVSVAGP